MATADFVSRIPMPRVRVSTPGGTNPSGLTAPSPSNTSASAQAPLKVSSEETPQRAPGFARRSTSGSAGSRVGRNAGVGVGSASKGTHVGGYSGIQYQPAGPRVNSTRGSVGANDSAAAASNTRGSSGSSISGSGEIGGGLGGSGSGIGGGGGSSSGGPGSLGPAVPSSVTGAAVSASAPSSGVPTSAVSADPYLLASSGSRNFNALASFSPMTAQMKESLQARLLSLPEQVASLSAALQKSNENLRTCHTSLKEVILKDEQMRARFHKAVQEGGLVQESPVPHLGVTANPSPGPDASWAYTTPTSVPSSRYVPASRDVQATPFPALSPAAFDAVATPAPKPPSKQLQAQLAKCQSQTTKLSDELHTLRGDAEALRGSLAAMFDDALRRVRQQVGAVTDAMERTSLARATERAELVAKESAEANVTARIKEREEALRDREARVLELEQMLANATRDRDDALQREEAAMAKYRSEMKERRRVFNQLQELRGNVRVFCRVRPLTADELADQQSFEATFPEEGQLVLRNVAAKGYNAFEFDNVFGPDATQGDVFQQFEPMLTSVLDGYHVCIFAFGQTGSGKTYTMDGPAHDWGVNLRTLAALFERMEQRSEDYEYLLSMSIVEIYNEQVRDLLAAKGAEEKLEVRQGPDGNYVPGATVLPISSLEEAIELFERGRAHRATFSTNMNEHSSRSHCLVMVNVKGQNLVSNAVLSGRLVLVDLAGSERVSKSEATGERLKEAQHINKSLSALGDVIQALALKNKHIPYRNSTLTYLLQDSLGGDGKTIMVVQISPATSNMQESLCSLNFAQRARGVETGPARRHLEQRSASADLTGLTGLDGPMDSGSEPSSPRSARASQIPSPSPRAASSLGAGASSAGGRGGPSSTPLSRSNSANQTPTLRRPAVVTPGGAKKR
eukprot:jgi/Mesvir1/1588/Mv14556-RA.1